MRRVVCSVFRYDKIGMGFALLAVLMKSDGVVEGHCGDGSHCLLGEEGLVPRDNDVRER